MPDAIESRRAALLESTDPRKVLHALRDPSVPLTEEAVRRILDAFPTKDAGEDWTVARDVQDALGLRLSPLRREKGMDPTDPNGPFGRILALLVEHGGPEVLNHITLDIGLLSPRHLRLMAECKDEHVRVNVASWIGTLGKDQGSEVLPRDLLDLLAQDSCDVVRQSIAARPFLPSDLCERLSSDTETFVRRAAAEDRWGDKGVRDLSDESLLRLFGEEDASISRAVSERRRPLPLSVLYAWEKDDSAWSLAERRQDLPADMQRRLFARCPWFKERMAERPDTALDLVLLALCEGRKGTRAAAVKRLAGASALEILDGLSVIGSDSPRRLPKITRLLKAHGFLAG